MLKEKQPDAVNKMNLENDQNMIKGILQRYLRRDSYINYYEVDSFIGEMRELLDEDVQVMIKETSYLDAFYLTSEIFLTTGSVDMDDPCCCLAKLAENCNAIWVLLLEMVPMDTKKVMFQWFTSHLDNTMTCFMEEYIEKLLMESFTEQEFVEALLSFTDRKVAEYEAKTDSWARRYFTEKWALRYLELMNITGSSWAEQQVYCKKHWMSSGIRMYYIDQCIDRKEYDTAIAMLKESQLLDKEYKGLVWEHGLKLKELNLLSGQKNDIILQQVKDRNNEEISIIAEY